MFKKIISTILSALLVGGLFGQGCSDAGVCSAGDMGVSPLDHIGDTTQENNKIQKVGISLSFGLGEKNTGYLTTQVEGNFQVGKSSYLQTKIPLTGYFSDYKGGFGVGDISLTFSQTVLNKNGFGLSFFSGLKIPTSRANSPERLPLVYQTSLGSLDVLLGTEFHYKGTQLGVGYQHSLLTTNNTYTGFLLEPTDSSSSFSNTNEFKRKPDIAVRIQQHFEFNKFLLNLGIISIFHIGNDTYETAIGNREEIIGSNGPTINLTAGMGYKPNEKSRINLQLAAPVLVRDVRPDGLTRSFVVQVGYQHSFHKK